MLYNWSGIIYLSIQINSHYLDSRFCLLAKLSLRLTKNEKDCGSPVFFNSRFCAQEKNMITFLNLTDSVQVSYFLKLLNSRKYTQPFQIFSHKPYKWLVLRTIIKTLFKEGFYDCAQEKIWTSTGLPPLPPQGSASTVSPPAHF